VVVGVLAGLSVLVRENAMVWLVLLLVWVVLTCRKRGLRPGFAAMGGLVLGVSLVLLPVGVRNRVVGGEWSISTFQAGPNFYIGNHSGADGRYQPLVRGHETPAFERGDATRLAELDRRRELSAREVSRYWMSRAVSDIRAQPAWWLKLMAKKMLMVWNRYEVSDAESQYVYEDYSVTLRVLGSVWHFGVLCPLAAVGVLATWPQRRRLWVYHALIVSMALAVALFYVMARYRYPLVPLLILFAAAGCVEAWRGVRSGAWRTLAWQALAAAVVAVVVNWPVHDEKRLNAMAWMNVGVVLAEEDDLAGATKYFQRAVAGHPESAEANNNLAQAMALQGDYAGAIAHYQKALAVEPTLLGVDYNLAVALEQVGRLDEALTHYERAVELDPSDANARGAVRRLRERER
ncbi:MAG: tetratricopeptide repeat protein, partial [Phycisphaerae bacterium]